MSTAKVDPKLLALIEKAHTAKNGGLTLEKFREKFLHFTADYDEKMHFNNKKELKSWLKFVSVPELPWKVTFDVDVEVTGMGSMDGQYDWLSFVQKFDNYTRDWDRALKYVRSLQDTRLNRRGFRDYSREEALGTFSLKKPFRSIIDHIGDSDTDDGEEEPDEKGHYVITPYMRITSPSPAKIFEGH